MLDHLEVQVEHMLLGGAGLKSLAHSILQHFLYGQAVVLCPVQELSCVEAFAANMRPSSAFATDANHPAKQATVLDSTLP
jgi:hypothetical protein